MNLRDLTLRARALLLPNRAERDLDDELQFHIERETLKLIEQGVSAGGGAHAGAQRASDR